MHEHPSTQGTRRDVSADNYDAELMALRQAIKTPRANRDLPTPPAPSQDAMREEPELAAALRDLKAGLLQVAENADDIVAEHPAASVGAAFLLGLAVGRLLRGI